MRVSVMLEPGLASELLRWAAGKEHDSEIQATDCSVASGTISRSRKKKMCDLGQIKAARGWVFSTKSSPSRVAEKLTFVSSRATVEFAHNGQVTSEIVELAVRCMNNHQVPVL